MTPHDTTVALDRLQDRPTPKPSPDPASFVLGLVILAGALFWGVAFVVAVWVFLA